VSGQLPPIDPATLPADIRTGPSAQRQAYETGLQFERMLVQQLTTQLEQTAQPTGDGEGDSGSDPAGGAYAQLLPDALTDGVMAAGGLGLARAFANAQEPRA
jgi:hypothetical protein